MTRRPRPPLFLARDLYRRRRLRDAARLLPVAGVLLLILPALWRGGGPVGWGAVYVFAVWALLIIAAAALAPGLSRPESTPGRGEGDD